MFTWEAIHRWGGGEGGAGKRAPGGSSNSPPAGRGSGSCSAQRQVEETQVGLGGHHPLTVSFCL